MNRCRTTLHSCLLSSALLSLPAYPPPSPLHVSHGKGLSRCVLLVRPLPRLVPSDSQAELRDPVPFVRCLGVGSVCRILRDFWEMIPAPVCLHPALPPAAVGRHALFAPFALAGKANLPF